MMRVYLRIAALGMLAALITGGAAAVRAGDAKVHGSISWLESLPKAKTVAKKQKKVIMADFGAEWCGPCKKMLETTYREQDVVELSKKFVPLLVDADRQSGLAAKYDVDAVPTVIFMDAKGKVLLRSTGYQEKEEMLKLMNAAMK